MTEERPGEGRREYPRPPALMLQDTTLIWLAALPAAERGRVIGALIAAFWGEGKIPPPESEPETAAGRAAVEAGLLTLARDRAAWEKKCDQRQAAARARWPQEREQHEQPPNKPRRNAVKPGTIPQGISPQEKAAIAELMAEDKAVQESNTQPEKREPTDDELRALAYSFHVAGGDKA